MSNAYTSPEGPQAVRVGGPALIQRQVCNGHRTLSAVMTLEGYLLRRESDRKQAPFYNTIYCRDYREYFALDEEMPDTIPTSPNRIIWVDFDYTRNRHCGCPSCHAERVAGTLEAFM